MTSIESLYSQRFETTLRPLAENLQQHLSGCFKDEPRIDRIGARAKSVSRFVAKAMKEQNGKRKYDDPLNEIQDQIGARIVTFYVSDVPRLSERVKGYFRHVEQQQLIPENESEFGYVGEHFILFLPEDIFTTAELRTDAPKFFELQIKTLFQHAWSEANHDLGYKPESPLSSYQKRQLAFTAAQSWGADQIFDQLHSNANQHSSGLRITSTNVNSDP